MPQPERPPSVDDLAMEYLRGAEQGRPPDITALAARLPDASSRCELRALVETAEWACAAFPEPFRPGASIGGRYVLLELLGSGGFGKAWRAKDERLGGEVVLELFHSLMEGAALDALLLRARDTLARLSHARAAQLRDSGCHGDTRFLVREFVPGQTLDRVLASLQTRGQASPEAVAAVLGEVPTGENGTCEGAWYRAAARTTMSILEVLCAAHRRGIHHGNLKPGNVLLREKHGPMVLDFGLADLVELTAVTRTGRMFGT
ncbi:MAG: phosphotransferase, partial [Planctomycetota bacterium]